MPTRLNLLIQQVFFGAFAFIASFGVYFLKDLAREVSEMNNKMAIVLLNISQGQETLKDHEERIRHIEKKIK